MVALATTLTRKDKKKREERKRIITIEQSSCNHLKKKILSLYLCNLALADVVHHGAQCSIKKN